MILGNLLKAVSSTVGTGISLKNATKSAPNSMGCYKIYYHGLKYVGKSEDGIRKRFVQYYNGTTAHYPSAKKIYQHRNEITVTWQVCNSREETRALEAKWIRQYDPEWNDRRGWESD
ncbi:MAG: GIY-YIG nuclease family protein [Lachnospiraceae bacterium]|nr:GIY-YIG nuclease family protein [Lachnospiraceae bacterium]MBP3567910.1 GIY-YIG nuclease family protein [Lachnospiraceae bacterium]